MWVVDANEYETMCTKLHSKKARQLQKRSGINYFVITGTDRRYARAKLLCF